MAGAVADMTAYNDALKIRFHEGEIKKMLYSRNPLLAMLPKRTDFTGREFRYPVYFGAPSGRSATFTAAQGGKYSSFIEEATITRVKSYALADIDGETLRASKGDPGAFFSAAETEVAGCIHQLGRDLAGQGGIYGNGLGTRGTVSTQTTVRIVLTNKEDIYNFELGMMLDVSATEAGEPDNAAARRIVTIDTSAGAFTTDTTITGATSGTFLRQHGDATISSLAKTKVTGLSAWVPETAPTTSLHGLPRADHKTRLGGVRTVGTGMSVEEALLDLSKECRVNGAEPDIVVLNPRHEVELDKNLSGRIRYSNVQSEDGVVGFESMKLRTGAGVVDIVGDPNCPVGVAYMLQLNTWMLATLGPIGMLDDDGNHFLRLSSSDAVEVRTGFYGNLYCLNPGFNGRCSLDT